MPANQQPAGQKQQPTTIEELKQWYVARKLPPEEVTRFFIGRNVTEPKAFGIYKDEHGKCVVYKNKADGQRAIRYQGPDEAYAVEELRLRLLEEIVHQKSKSHDRRACMGSAVMASSRSSSMSSGPSRPSSLSGSKRRAGSSSSPLAKAGCFRIGLVVAVFIAILALGKGGVPNGYYGFRGGSYYRQGSSWYMYNPRSNQWLQTQSLDEFITSDNASQYRISGVDGMRFEDSQWYVEPTSSDNSWDDDSDYDWDSDDDDWDSDDTDWDDDW